ncbi:MAG: RNA methyltransferase [Flavobacteriales bacterium]|nr:RNA methyltransferase [Flavobacteriales bacterium]
MISRNQIKFVKSLQQKKYRILNKSFVVESTKNVLEILSSSYDISYIFATSSWINSNKISSTLEINEVTKNDLKRISGQKTASEVLAVVKMPEFQKIFDFSGVNIALDNIKDPGNFGTIIRICDWFGIKNIYCSKNSVDLYNPKVVQSTMGSISRVNVFYTDLTQMINSLDDSVMVYASVMNGHEIQDCKLSENSLIVFGNESHGISQEVLNLTNEKITIIKKGNAESLNVSVSVGIILNKFCN